MYVFVYKISIIDAIFIYRNPIIGRQYYLNTSNICILNHAVCSYGHLIDILTFDSLKTLSYYIMNIMLLTLKKTYIHAGLIDNYIDIITFKNSLSRPIYRLLSHGIIYDTNHYDFDFKDYVSNDFGIFNTTY